MVFEFYIFTFLSRVLNVIFRLIFLPSYNRDKESNIFFGDFNDETSTLWVLICNLQRGNTFS
jgi:hypothetical protein